MSQPPHRKGELKSHETLCKEKDLETFIEHACKTGHPLLSGHQIPEDLNVALEKILEWDDAMMSDYRAHWCKKWLKRALELRQAEKEDAAQRPGHARSNTVSKHLLVTEQILEELGYEDIQVLQLLREGATLAGDIEPTPVFQKQYKPCMQTLPQLHEGARVKNQAILNMTRSSGSQQVDQTLLDETMDEVAKGWARGPFRLDELEPDAVVSRRFPLQQSNKTQLIDDFSVSGINETCTVHNKVDLHMIDTLAALTNKFFLRCEELGADSTIRAKTFDLKSAYRQIPVKEEHLRYAYFSIYNCQKGHAEVYQLVTLPFGATHSVYAFLRFAKMLHFIATRGLYLLSANFFDDFILLSRPAAQENASRAMELVFMITGWEFAREGKKKTEFSSLCKALGVVVDLSLSSERKMLIENTEQRKNELKDMIMLALEKNSLSRQEALVLRGKLGFADSFVHGRLGVLVLSKLIEHAYGTQKTIDESLKTALKFILARLQFGKPRMVSAKRLKQWYIFSDASFQQEEQIGGLGGVLIDDLGACLAWFGLQLNSAMCHNFGADVKDTIIYELEMLAAVLSMLLWGDRIAEGLQVLFLDNEAVRFALIKGHAEGCIANALMRIHLVHEATQVSQAWFARVPTESNIGDPPSRNVNHPLLKQELAVTDSALEVFESLILNSKELAACELKGEMAGHTPPVPSKRKRR